MEHNGKNMEQNGYYSLSGYMSEQEASAIYEIQKVFLESYINTKDKMPVKEWLLLELKKHFPELPQKDIMKMSSEIIDALNVTEEKKESLQKAVASGRSKESWLSATLTQHASQMSAQEGAEYLQSIDAAVKEANNNLSAAIKTKSDLINQSPSLDGFIAEEYHAQTFNMNAEAKGSSYRAKVLKPDNGTYKKNSVDIEIVDETGKVVRRYQAKYYKDANATQKAFEQGDYRGQRRLVPEGQETVKNSVSVIEAPDGTTSNPLSKERAEQLRNEAQSGQWKELNWNEYQIKDLVTGIGKQAGYACLQGAVVGAGVNIASKVWNEEPIDGEEILETALVTGADFGIKTATAGALKVASEKGLLKAIPKGTSGNVFANIAFVGIENAKVLGKVATKELTVKEGIDKMQQTTVSCVTGIASSAEGATAGAAIGSVLGPIGTTVGGFIGGAVGYMAGSKVGETVVKGVQKIRDKPFSLASTAVSSFKSKISGAVSDLAGLFGF